MGDISVPFPINFHCNFVKGSGFAPQYYSPKITHFSMETLAGGKVSFLQDPGRKDTGLLGTPLNVSHLNKSRFFSQLN